MFADLYYALLDGIKKKDENSPIYKYHINFVKVNCAYYDNSTDYADDEPNQIVVDFIASMTDDYFVALHEKMFPDSPYKIEYKSYFEE